MKSLEQLKTKIDSFKKEFSEEYFIFIAPYELKHWRELRIDDYVHRKIQPPDILLQNQKLDIFFVKRKSISGMNINKAVVFQRYRDMNLKDISK